MILHFSIYCFSYLDLGCALLDDGTVIQQDPGQDRGQDEGQGGAVSSVTIVVTSEDHDIVDGEMMSYDAQLHN